MHSLPEERPLRLQLAQAMLLSRMPHHRKAHTNCYLDSAGGAGAEAQVDAAEGALAKEAAQPHVIKGHLLL